MLEEIQGFYDKLFTELKAYIIEKSSYNPYVFKQEPESKLFPLVVVKNTNRNSTYTTLKYTDAKVTFALQINVFAVKQDTTSGKTICDELSNIIETFFTNVYRMNVKINSGMINIDENVDRTVINVMCTLDTKFKDKLVIYPS